MDDEINAQSSNDVESHDSESFDTQMKTLMNNIPTVIHSDPNTNDNVPITGGTSSPASIDIYDAHIGHSQFMADESVLDMNIDKFYTDTNLTRPIHTELTLLILYIKSQKHLYKRASTYYRFQQNMAVIPTIILSMVATLLSAYTNHPWVHIFITTTNALIACIISLLRYFSPETKAKTCMFMADSLGGMETKMNMLLHKMGDDMPTIIRTAIHNVELEMDELTKLHKVTIPSPIYNIMPIISYISIFTFIRYINEYKYDLYANYLNIKAESKHIREYWASNGIYIHMPDYNKDTIHNFPEHLQHNVAAAINRLQCLEVVKNGIKEKLTLYRDAFHNIDELYSSEIRFAETHNVLFHYLCGQRKRRSITHLHPVIQRVLRTYDELGV